MNSEAKGFKPAGSGFPSSILEAAKYTGEALEESHRRLLFLSLGTTPGAKGEKNNKGKGHGPPRSFRRFLSFDGLNRERFGRLGGS